jgi:hypothetical protein
MSDEPRRDSVDPLRLALGMIFCAVAFHVFLAPHGAREAWPGALDGSQFFFLPVLGAGLGLAIEAASCGLRNANLAKTARYFAWGAVLVITVAWQRPAAQRIPFGPGHYFAEPVLPWQFFSLFVGVLLGLAIETAYRLWGANFRKTTRDVMLWAVVGIMVAALIIECISEASAVRGPKGYGENPEILVVEDFLRKLIVLPIAAVIGGSVGFLIRRHRARREGLSDSITDNSREPSSSRMVGLFCVLCGIVCGIAGSVLGGYVAPTIEQREFPEIWAKLQLPLAMTLAGILFGGCFGWLFGWVLASLLRHKHLRGPGDPILLWVFGLFPISVATAVIVISGTSFEPNGYPREGPSVTIDLIDFFFDHAAWLIIALVAYPLSSGPAYSFAIRHSSFFRPVELIYAPLFWLTGHCPPLRNAQRRYMEFWAVHHRSVSR